MTALYFLLLLLATSICDNNGEPRSPHIRSGSGTKAARSSGFGARSSICQRGVEGENCSSSPTRSTVNANKQGLLPREGNGYMHTRRNGYNESDVIFKLYTRSTRFSPEVIIIGNPSTLGTFNASHPTKLGIPGTFNYKSDLEDVRDAWLDNGEYNMIIVDWTRLSREQGYFEAKSSVEFVGETVAKCIDYLVTQGANGVDMELVGYQLGAHVAGVAGNRTAERIGRITALDPIALLYVTEDGYEAGADRIDALDASSVYVIHTSLYSIEEPIGHADFYPNGGKRQPGCRRLPERTCSSIRSHILYSESVNTGVGFWSTQCDTYYNFRRGKCSSNLQVLMGATTPIGARGTFYLRTNDSPPYASG